MKNYLNVLFFYNLPKTTPPHYKNDGKLVADFIVKLLCLNDIYRKRIFFLLKNYHLFVIKHTMMKKKSDIYFKK